MEYSYGVLSHLCLLFIVLVEVTYCMMPLYKSVFGSFDLRSGICICEIVCSETWEVCPVALTSLSCVGSYLLVHSKCCAQSGCGRLFFLLGIFRCYTVFAWEIWRLVNRIYHIVILFGKSLRQLIWLLNLYLFLLWCNCSWWSACSLFAKRYLLGGIILKSPSIQPLEVRLDHSNWIRQLSTLSTSIWAPEFGMNLSSLVCSLRKWLPHMHPTLRTLPLKHSSIQTFFIDEMLLNFDSIKICRFDPTMFSKHLLIVHIIFGRSVTFKRRLTLTLLLICLSYYILRHSGV